MNNKCFWKSLEKDYTDIIKVAIIICCVGLSLSMAYVLNQPLINFLKSIPASYTLSLSVIAIPIYAMYDIAVTNYSFSKNTPASFCIPRTLFFTLCTGGMVILCYMSFLGFTGTSYYNGGYELVGVFISEALLAITVSAILPILGIPVALAYARCKDEPPEKLTNNEV